MLRRFLSRPRLLLTLFLGVLAAASPAAATDYMVQTVLLQADDLDDGLELASFEPDDVGYNPTFFSAKFFCKTHELDINKNRIMQSGTITAIIASTDDGKVHKYAPGNSAFSWAVEEIGSTNLYTLSFYPARVRVNGTPPGPDHLEWCAVRFIMPTEPSSLKGALPNEASIVNEGLYYAIGPSDGTPNLSLLAAQFQTEVPLSSTRYAEGLRSDGLSTIRYFCAHRGNVSNGFTLNSAQLFARAVTNESSNRVAWTNYEQNGSRISLIEPAEGDANTTLNFRINMYENCLLTMTQAYSATANLDVWATDDLGKADIGTAQSKMQMLIGPSDGQESPLWQTILTISDSDLSREPYLADVTQVCATRGGQKGANTKSGGIALITTTGDSRQSQSTENSRLRWSGNELQFASTRYENCLLDISYGRTSNYAASR